MQKGGMTPLQNQISNFQPNPTAWKPEAMI